MIQRLANHPYTVRLSYAAVVTCLAVFAGVLQEAMG